MQDTNTISTLFHDITGVKPEHVIYNGINYTVWFKTNKPINLHDIDAFLYHFFEDGSKKYTHRTLICHKDMIGLTFMDELL